MKYVRLITVAVCMMFYQLTTTHAQDADPLQIVMVTNGSLGDKSFFDSAQRGLDRAAADFNVAVDTIEFGSDPTMWESGLADVMAGTEDYDVLIVGTVPMVGFLAPRVHLYPEKTFILYDAGVPYDDPELCIAGCENVYSIMYAQNEGAFLAGVYAGTMTTRAEAIDGINEEVIVGVIGGQALPVINDFIVGYEQGACLANPDAQVIVQYAGAWFDPARGKEVAQAMYEQGADVIFQVAGGTGLGVFEAAEEQNHYAIGVDSDQAQIIMETDPQQALRILTSMMKNVDNTLYRAIELYLAGELPVGTAETLGIETGGVGLAYNDIYQASTPEDVQDFIAAVEEAVINGDIEVVSVFGENAVDVGAGCDAMPDINAP